MFVCRAVNCMKSTLFFPVVPYILKIAVLSLWLGAVVIIAAGSHPQYRFANNTLCVPEQLSVRTAMLPLACVTVVSSCLHFLARTPATFRADTSKFR